jgi:NitT/TauT family transport system substrate-binding protein
MADRIRLALATRAASTVPATVAERNGLFSKYGLDVEVIAPGGSIDVLDGLARGDSDVAALAASGVVERALDGAPFVLFASASQRPFHAIVTRPDITSADQLRGKRIGYNGLNDELSGRLALAQIGLSMPEDVTGVRIGGDGDARIVALRENTIDASVVSPPMIFRAKKAGYRELVNLADTGLEFQSGAFATRRDFMAGQRDVLLRFTRAISEAIHIFKTNKAEGLAALAAHTSATDPEEVEDSWNVFALKCQPDVPAISLPGLRFAMDHVVQHADARRRKPEEFVDTSLVDDLRAEGFYDALWKRV